MKILSLQSVKSSGATTIALNTAVVQKQLNPHLSVGMLQLNKFVDLHTYCGGIDVPSWNDILRFQGSSEWGRSLLSKGAQSYFGVDVWTGVSGKEWESCNKESLEDLWALLSETYDVLVLDINTDIPELIWDFIQQQEQQRIIVSTVCPSALSVLSETKKYYSKPYHVLLNQSPLKQEVQSKSFLGSLQTDCIGVLPSEDRRFWEQVYEGIPVVMHKKSRWRAALIEVLKKLDNQYHDA